MNALSESSYFTILNATSGYHQIPVADEDILKTAFLTRSGLFEYVRMFFGLFNVSAALRRLMDELFSEEKGKFLRVYLDDIII